MFEITLAGTGGMMPLPDRFLTGLFLSCGGASLLVDCGEGMQVALSKWGCRISRLDTILITHIHADHTAGLPGLLLSEGNAGRTEAVNIYCPEKTAKIIAGTLSICGGLPFDVIFKELPTDKISVFEWQGLHISSMPLKHRLSCFGYSFREDRLPVFDPKKAQALNIPQKLWRVLHSGGTAEADGKVYTQKDVISDFRAPLKLTYVTDSLYFPEIAKFAENSDLLICEGMYGDDEYIPKMREKRHMVFSQAAKTAAESNSKELWLTHYSPALKNPKEYESAVRAIFKNTVISKDGQTKTLK